MMYDAAGWTCPVPRRRLAHAWLEHPDGLDGEGDDPVFIKVLAPDVVSGTLRVPSSHRQDTELTFYFICLGKQASVALGSPDIVTAQRRICGISCTRFSFHYNLLCFHPPGLVQNFVLLLAAQPRVPPMRANSRRGFDII